MLCKFTYSGLINILVQAQVMILWGFLDTLTKFLSTVRLWLGSIVDVLIFKINIFEIGPFIYPSGCIVCVLEICCSILLDTFGVAVARYGLILWETELRAPGRFLDGSGGSGRSYKIRKWSLKSGNVKIQ